MNASAYERSTPPLLALGESSEVQTASDKVCGFVLCDC